MKSGSGELTAIEVGVAGVSSRPHPERLGRTALLRVDAVLGSEPSP